MIHRDVDQLPGLDENGSGNVSLEVAGRIADVHQQPAFGLDAGELFRFDDSW